MLVAPQVCIRCLRRGYISPSDPRAVTATVTGGTRIRKLLSSSSAYEHSQEDFEDVVGELKRRKRKADAKRRQYGNSFVDHVLVTVRGGKGGSGAAALEASLRGPSSPSGGNGGPGGSVYLRTSSSLTSLSGVSKRLIGGQGNSGSGSFKHGRRGEDVFVTVPIGTIVRELKREGEDEKILREEGDLGLDEEERRKRKWMREFVIHPSAGGNASIEEYQLASSHLKKEGRLNIPTPSFDKVPPVIYDIEEEVKEPLLLASGGQGGLGNPFFPTPRIASRGFAPPTRTFEFELKLLADVGFVGFPNAGKSTLLRALTGRKAEIAGYQFTTLNPQVGVVRVYDDGSWATNHESILGDEEDGVVEETWIERKKEEERRSRGEYVPTNAEKKRDSNSIKAGHAIDKRGKVERIRFTIADNPGLLPQASANVGLGHSFLRSIERSLILVYVLDLTRSNPSDDLRILKEELEAYKEGLSSRAGVIVLNKGDKVDQEQGMEKFENVKQTIDGQQEVIVLSGKHAMGLDKLVDVLAEKVKVARIAKKDEKKDIKLISANSTRSQTQTASASASTEDPKENERSTGDRMPTSTKPRLGFGLKAPVS